MSDDFIQYAETKTIEVKALVKIHFKRGNAESEQDALEAALNLFLHRGNKVSGVSGSGCYGAEIETAVIRLESSPCL